MYEAELEASVVAVCAAARATETVRLALPATITKTDKYS
jgi:hypothetical protein